MNENILGPIEFLRVTFAHYGELEPPENIDKLSRMKLPHELKSMLALSSIFYILQQHHAEFKKGGI